MNRFRVSGLVVLIVVLAALLLSCADSNPMTKASDIDEPVLIGDVAPNGALDIEDLVIFLQYFVHGHRVFRTDYYRQIAATDCNRDGIPLHVADLVYLESFMYRDGGPPESLQPDTVRLRQEDGYLTIDGPVAKAFIVTSGDTPPNYLSPSVSGAPTYVWGQTWLLLQPAMRGGVIEGTFIRITGELVEIQFSTLEGAAVVIEEWPGQ